MGHDWVTGRQRGRFERIQRGRHEARRLRKRRYKASLTDGETRTRTISEPLAGCRKTRRRRGWWLIGWVAWRADAAAAWLARARFGGQVVVVVVGAR